jgi:predicted secreted hydrolase
MKTNRLANHQDSSRRAAKSHLNQWVRAWVRQCLAVFNRARDARPQRFKARQLYLSDAARDVQQRPFNARLLWLTAAARDARLRPFNAQRIWLADAAYGARQWPLSVRLLWLGLAGLLAGCDAQTPPPQGFAGLGSSAGDFADVRPGRIFSFPQDHGAHPAHRIEWWYVTANLQDEQGRNWGVQWTLFRNALQPRAEVSGWNNPTVWMGHAGLTGPFGHRYAETLARGGIGQAGVNAAPFKAWIDDWQLSGQFCDPHCAAIDTPKPSAASGPTATTKTSAAITPATTSQLSAATTPATTPKLSTPTEHAPQTTPAQPPQKTALQLSASGSDFAYQLQLSSDQALVLQGDQGFSQKSGQGQASYYYSQPFLQARGNLELDGKTYKVTGQAWLDREWSSQPLAADQQGWDWFSLHLASGEKIMLFQLRHADGRHYRAGTWISANGVTQALSGEDFRLTPLAHSTLAGRRLPTRWALSIPGKQLELRSEPLQENAWMDTRFPYWEGPIRLSGSQSGVGYLEMTGY